MSIEVIKGAFGISHLGDLAKDGLPSPFSFFPRRCEEIGFVHHKEDAPFSLDFSMVGMMAGRSLLALFMNNTDCLPVKKRRLPEANMVHTIKGE